MAAPRITLDLGSTMGPSGKERAAAGKMLQEMDRMIEAERRRVREEIAAAQIPERDPALLWLDGIAGRMEVDRLLAAGKIVPSGEKLDFPEAASQAEVARMFREWKFTSWTEIAVRILVRGDMPDVGTLKRSAQR